MSDTLILEILLGVLVLICAIITNAALWPTPPRSPAVAGRQTAASTPPSGGPARTPETHRRRRPGTPAGTGPGRGR